MKSTNSWIYNKVQKKKIIYIFSITMAGCLNTLECFILFFAKWRLVVFSLGYFLKVWHPPFKKK